MHGKKRLANVVFLSSIVVLSILTIAVVSSAAEKFPSREIIIIVPFSPGGAMDLSCRVVAEYLNNELGVPVVVDNRPEAASIQGVIGGYRAKPDGYTLLAVIFPRNAIAQVVYNAPFKMLDFTYLAGYERMVNFLAVRKDSPYKTLKDLIEASKKKSLNCSIGGMGSGSHFNAAVSLKKGVGLDLEIVPFKGSAPALMALLGGNVDLTTLDETSLHVQLKNTRYLGIFSKQRSPRFPDVPTFKELGYDVPILPGGLFGTCGPPGLPKEISKILSDALAKAVKNPGFISKIGKMNATPIYLSGPELRVEVESVIEIVTTYKDIFATQ